MEEGMNREYNIERRPANLGGGWRLQLIDDGIEVGGGVFPADVDSEAAMSGAYDCALAEADAWIETREGADDLTLGSMCEDCGCFECECE
jgi:hypothetical protein